MKANGMKNRVRQGHTRWLVTFVAAEKNDRNEDICLIYSAFVTQVSGKSVSYDAGKFPYIAGQRWFLENTEKTYRKAVFRAHSVLSGKVQP
jgi:hypothetical protein